MIISVFLKYIFDVLRLVNGRKGVEKAGECPLRTLTKVQVTKGV